MINKQLSLEIAEMIDVTSGKCWFNSVNAIRYADHPALDTAFYVEGYAISDIGVPVTHGWIELENGDIVDVTWLDEKHAQYFSGVKYSAEYIVALDPDELPLVWETGGRNGFGNADYKQSCVNAFAAIGVELKI